MARTHGRPFIKMHGLRNHFVIVDARLTPFRPAVDDIVRICDPEVGVGGDQLVVVEPGKGAAGRFSCGSTTWTEGK